MQAVVYEHFGDESVLSLREVAVPHPLADKCRCAFVSPR
jgi:hypothetical protein